MEPRPRRLPAGHLSLVAWISGHGFGHWTRSEAVLSALSTEHPVHVRTSGRALLLARKAPWAASVREVDTGPGVVQRGPLDVDVPATARRLAEHLERWEEVAARGAADARRLGARAVFADVPPVAFAVAARAGLPAIAMANFTWSWAYEHYVGQDPVYSRAVSRFREAERSASGAIRLPGGGGLDVFPVGSAPLALRRAPTCSRAEARRRLRALSGDSERPHLLVSFGGYGDALDLSAAARSNPGWRVLSFARPRATAPNLTVLPHDHDLPHQDLVYGADAVLAKPGYGTISECLNGPTPLVYVEPGGGFREHASLVELVRRWLPSAALPRASLEAGAWGAALRAAVAHRPPEAPPPPGTGKAVASIRTLLRGQLPLADVRRQD